MDHFRISNSKIVSTPLGYNTKLSIKKYPQSESTPYSSGFGSIMYGMVCSRPNLAYTVSIVSRFMVNIGIVHWQTLTSILRYLIGSLKGGFKYTRTTLDEDALEGYVDADYVSNVDTRKSLSGFEFYSL
jgi:hypothetical protein